MNRRRLAPNDRRNEILSAAICLADAHGYDKITRSQVAKLAQCAAASVSKYFGTMNQFRRTIIRHAIKNECLRIIAQGLINNDKHALKASEELKQRAIKSIQ